MTWFRHIGNIKIGLLFLALVIIGSLLWYSQWIVNRIRDDNREIVSLYAEIIANTVNEKSDENLNFIFDEIIKKVRFPIIYSDPDNNPIYYRNLPENLSSAALLKEQKSMDIQNSPIILEYLLNGDSKFTLGYLHYGDSALIRQLEWLPYLEIGGIALFILLGFAGFNVIRNSEKQNIWVGMARETAHQLGTPVSALLGWVERLKSHPEDQEEIAGEMITDLRRLDQVSERFSKIGAKSAFQKVNMNLLADDVAAYLLKRLPSLGKNISLEIIHQEEVNIMGNGVLISWALENIIRNSIDALGKNKGKITVIILPLNPGAVLRIEDNGTGIDKSEWKNIFRAGFSTKSRGWGMGLSLVKRIVVDIHGGYIHVVESSKNKKTVMEARFK
ncbi:MAG: HAMP domain-containing sensor histidine kinase [Candidatus Neomarinimicrobiota bacterium]